MGKTDFDPNAASTEDSGVYGLPFTREQSKLVLIPVPWDATTSYRPGTHKGPEAILEASRQVDLFDLELGNFYEAGIYMLESPKDIEALNTKTRAQAELIIEKGGRIEGDKSLEQALSQVNQASSRLNDWVESQTRAQLNDGKLVGIIGGDHSVPLGAFKAITEKHGSVGVLHFDAHSDTRVAFEGFKYSHASIMFNALEECPGISKIVQVGIRDFCEEEHALIQKSPRLKTYFDLELKRRLLSGETWKRICDEVIAALPDKVWVSFDIDALDPAFCPSTGTPVPGGLSYDQANFLISQLGASGKQIVGFDLNEVAPDPRGENEWDANVGARLAYRLCGWTLSSQKRNG